MLVTSKKRYLPTAINTLVLAKDDYFFYIHRDVYDKALILANRYSLDELIRIVEPSSNPIAIQYFYDHVPAPIHILAPFLGLVTSDLPEDIEILTGAIHVITAATDVIAYTQVHTELRKTLEFSLYIQEEYEMAWERFFITSIPYEERTRRVNPQPSDILREPLHPTMTSQEYLSKPIKNEEYLQENLETEKTKNLAKEMEKEMLRSILDINE